MDGMDGSLGEVETTLGERSFSVVAGVGGLSGKRYGNPGRRKNKHIVCSVSGCCS